MFIRDLKVGQVFTLTGNSTAYTVAGKTYWPGQGCTIAYTIGDNPNAFTFTKPGLTTCTIEGN